MKPVNNANTAQQRPETAQHAWMAMDTFSTLLHELGLERYSAIFAENDVDLEALRLLSERELQELGITLGHRKKLLKAIGELNGGATTAPSVQLTSERLLSRSRSVRRARTR